MEDGQPIEERGIELTQMITFRLSRLQARVNAQAARILKETAGISLSQWRIFVMIESYGETAPADFVRRTGFDKGQVSRTVSGMIADGLVTSRPSESDQRSHLIDFSAKGFALFERARPAMRARQARLTGCLSDEERRVIYTAFDKLEKTMEEMERGA